MFDNMDILRIIESYNLQQIVICDVNECLCSHHRNDKNDIDICLTCFQNNKNEKIFTFLWKNRMISAIKKIILREILWIIDGYSSLAIKIDKDLFKIIEYDVKRHRLLIYRYSNGWLYMKNNPISL